MHCRLPHLSIRLVGLEYSDQSPGFRANRVSRHVARIRSKPAVHLTAAGFGGAGHFFSEARRPSRVTDRWVNRQILPTHPSSPSRFEFARFFFLSHISRYGQVNKF